MTNQPLKVQFAPGCFDDFEGTQAELDHLVADIHSRFEGMTATDLKTSGQVVDLVILGQTDPELAQRLTAALEGIEGETNSRILQ